MKKLTAGIFTVLMGLVTVNAAEAAVASKGYVDEVAKAAAADVTALEATVSANKTAADEAIAAAQKAGDDAAAALASYQTSNDAAVGKNAEDIAKNATAIATNATSISNNATAIATEKSDREAADTALGGRLDTAETNITTLQGDVAALSGDGENSVATQIASALSQANAYTDAEVKELADGAVKANTAAISAMDTAYKAADTTLQGNIDTLSGTVSDMDAAYKAADAAIDTKIGTVVEGKTVVEMIADAQTAATFDPTEIEADIKANADAIDAIETSDYATSGITAEKVSAYDAYATEIATKLTNTTAISEDGKYVLTAVTVGEDTTYAWELITRETAVQE